MHSLPSFINLSPITLGDHKTLAQLMRKIYLPVYAHLWFDEGEHYLEKNYSFENLSQELSNAHTQYYFVMINKKEEGIFKFDLKEPMPGTEDLRMVKLHRIYLSGDVRGRGVGKFLLDWLWENFCKEAKHRLWLEAMDTQESAIGFYKRMGFEIASSFTFEDKIMKEELRGMLRMVKG